VNSLALKADGSIIEWGANYWGQSDPPGGTVSSPIVERYSYDVFGKPTIKAPDGSTRTTSNYGNLFMFTGREYDSETGLYYYRARFYKPSIGRFLQTDPVGYKSVLNPYTYCKNNPTRWIDPSGRIIVVQGDAVSVAQASAYLWNSSRFIDTFAYLNNRPETHTITTNSNDNDSYDSHNIDWDPHSALCTTSGGVQSPALGLAHELEHAKNDAQNNTGSLTYDPSNPYDDEEEQYAITGPETDIANELGEGKRCDHHGDTYDVSEPWDL
jgi:RHS repeat-associated protein